MSGSEPIRSLDAIVLVSAPEVTAVPVADCGDPLVPVPDGERLGTDDRLADPDGHYRLVRREVLARLQRAADQLPAGVMLRLVEGYRPVSLQARYFNAYRDQLAQHQPDLDAQQLDRLASRSVAPPGPAAPHLSGGAVDVTLYGPDGRELDMGSAVNATPEESAGACYTAYPGLAEAARRHRRWLVAALSSAGFTNYPTEWWHWSYGDRYWALDTKSGWAHYGPATPPA